MKIGLFTVVFNDKPLEEVADVRLGPRLRDVRARRVAGVEPLRHRPRRRATRPTRRELKKMLARSRHRDLGALEPPLRRRWCCRSATLASTSGPAPRTRKRWSSSAPSTSSSTAEVASELEIPIVYGFFGSTVWESWYIWPPQRLDIYEKGWDLFVERWNPILDRFKELGVRFAHEVHPTEIAYNVYTAREAIKRLDRDDWGFNFDPSHLDLADDRPRRVHQGVRRPHPPRRTPRTGSCRRTSSTSTASRATGSWQRNDRAARYRVPGWGDVEWRRVITALLEVGYDYVLSFEHEDPVMSEEDGCEQASSSSSR